MNRNHRVESHKSNTKGFKIKISIRVLYEGCFRNNKIMMFETIYWFSISLFKLYLICINQHTFIHIPECYILYKWDSEESQ